MDLQILLNRKIELEKARNDIANTWNILTGHIQECDFLITQLSLPKVEDENKVEETVENPDNLPVE